MDKNKVLELVKPKLTAARFAHTERVVETALELARLYDVNQEDTILAAALHDYAKYRDVNEMANIIKEHQLPLDLLSYHHELWHGPVASILIETELSIANEAVQSAIFWHTTGSEGMTELEKVIYLADYIEPGRDFAGIETVRKKAYEHLNEACFLAVRNTIQFLAGREYLIYPETLKMYNDLKRKLEETI